MKARIGAAMKMTQEQYRYFLKDTVRLTIDFSETDQSRGKPAPPIQKSPPPEAKRIDLVPVHAWKGIGAVDLTAAIAARQSLRSFLPDPLSADELSYLLWACQGIRAIASASTAFRTVPSAGCRHSFETYVCCMNAAGLVPGIYRYLPVEHQLVVVSEIRDVGPRLAAAALGQAFVGKAAATFVWTAMPYRMEWRYGLAAHKVIAIDIGHVCQNLYLACAAVKAGTCAVAAYHQDALDRLLGIDGEDEFALYLAPVGKVVHT
jgi:SagB-type dehydrogenase family enzyme